jgi:hypothetical protein
VRTETAPLLPCCACSARGVFPLRGDSARGWGTPLRQRVAWFMPGDYSVAERERGRQTDKGNRARGPRCALSSMPKHGRTSRPFPFPPHSYRKQKAEGLVPRLPSCAPHIGGNRSPGGERIVGLEGVEPPTRGLGNRRPVLRNPDT